MTERREGGSSWSATVRVTVPDATLARWLVRALGPEASREVPRIRARVRERGAGAVEVEMEGDDAGALRAALNTYLGWIHLSLSTADAALARSPPKE